MSRSEELKDIEIANLRGSYEYARNTLADALGYKNFEARALEYYAREAAEFIERHSPRKSPPNQEPE